MSRSPVVSRWLLLLQWSRGLGRASVPFQNPPKTATKHENRVITNTRTHTRTHSRASVRRQPQTSPEAINGHSPRHHSAALQAHSSRTRVRTHAHTHARAAVGLGLYDDVCFFFTRLTLSRFSTERRVCEDSKICRTQGGTGHTRHTGNDNSNDNSNDKQRSRRCGALPACCTPSCTPLQSLEWSGRTPRVPVFSVGWLRSTFAGGQSTGSIPARTTAAAGPQRSPHHEL